MEHPAAETRSTPAVAMLTLSDAMEGDLRMVNREFVGGVVSTYEPTPDRTQQCPGQLRQAVARGHHQRSGRGARCGLRCCRKGIDDPVHRCVVMGSGEEPGFENGRRKVNAGVQHGVEERGGVSEAILPLGVVVVVHAVAEVPNATEKRLPARWMEWSTPASSRAEESAAESSSERAST